jgi:hypothetical protein
LLFQVQSVSLDGIARRVPTAEADDPARNIRISMECISHDRVRLRVFWDSSHDGAQWVDLSLFNNGFARGTFLGAGPLGSDVESLRWDGLLEDRTHFLRVNTATGEGWKPSVTVFFKTPDCGGQFLGALNLHVVSQQCLDNGKVRLNLAWQPSGRGGQWIDLTLFNNNFARGTFIGLGPYPSSQSTFTWDNLLSGLTHYLRVNTLTSSGWFPSQTIVFNTIHCEPDDDDDIPAGFTLGPVSVNGSSAGTLLVDVRIGEHPNDGFDRIVFEFDGPVPDADIEYVDGVEQCGSGESVAIPGIG